MQCIEMNVYEEKASVIFNTGSTTYNKIKTLGNYANFAEEEENNSCWDNYFPLDV